MKFNSKKIVKLLSIVLCCVLVYGVNAQDSENLIPNGSFESIDKKPKRLGSIESAIGWVSPTGVRADLFSDNKVEDINVPFNIYGKEEAKEGGNYAGFVAYTSGGKVPRSYLMTRLNSPLKKGMRYCVKLNVSLAEASKYACNNLGAVFTSKPFGTDGKVPIIEEPSVLHFKNEVPSFNFTARYGWTEICATFIAKGGEKYITIGNFRSDENTSSESMKKDKDIKVVQIIAAYYYIDDISMVLVNPDKGEKCDCAALNSGTEEYSRTIYQKTFNITEEMTTKSKIEIQEIYFAFGRDKLSAQGIVSLKMIAELLKENPEMKLELMGHNNADEDEVGMNNDYYADMDNKRIGTVMEFLIENGIAEERLIASQKGSEINSPDISDTDSDDLKLAKDRRVTFKVR